MGEARSLEGRVAIVTGGAGGIGRATALELTTRGAQVMVADVDAELGIRVASEVRDRGGRAHFQAADVSSAEQVTGLVGACLETFGQLDIMFNNAGISGGGPLLEWTPDMFERVVAVNQTGVFYGIQAAARAMRDRGHGGVIINTGSIFGELASWGTIGYQATKAAVAVMTRVAALELAPLGIRVVNVAPGVTDTRMVDGYREIGWIDTMARKHMRGELIRPEAVAQVVAFAASDAASCINGTTLFADDGYSAFK